MTDTAGAKPPQAVLEAMELHRAGRLEEAEHRYRALLPQFPGVPDLYYGIGFLMLQKGQSAEAVTHLEKVRGMVPGHAKALNALGSAYLGLRRAKDAEARFGEAYRAEPSAMVAENWATAARHAGAFQTIVNILESATAAGHASPKLQSLAAHAIAALGDRDRAAEVANQAARAAPNDPEVRHVAGLIASVRMLPKEAIEHLEQAVRLVPAAARLHIDLAWAYLLGERAGDAAEAFKAAAERAGPDAEILRDCAIGLERLNRLEEAEALAERAVVARPWDVKLATVRSALARRGGRLQQAFDIMAPVMREAAPEHRDPWFEWAQVLDLVEEPDLAAQAYRNANDLWLAYPNAKGWPREAKREMEARLAGLESLSAMDPVQDPPQELAPLPFKVIFLTGFPRSGTTLADRILGAHSAVTILEEKGLIEAALKQVEEKYGPYPACLPALARNKQDIEALRAMYVDGVQGYGGAPGGVALDKHPINFWRLGLVRVLFPEAPILELRRHPLDTVLSCWQQNFRHTPTLSAFATLPDAAAAYDQWHRLVEGLGRALPLDPVVLKYEDLAAEPEKTIRAVLPDLGLDWEEGMAAFQERTVSDAVVISASYRQVGEEINTKAVGKWARYDKALSPVKSVLKPWCDRFGYPV